MTSPSSLDEWDLDTEVMSLEGLLDMKTLSSSQKISSLSAGD